MANYYAPSNEWLYAYIAFNCTFLALYIAALVYVKWYKQIILKMIAKVTITIFMTSFILRLVMSIIALLALNDITSFAFNYITMLNIALIRVNLIIFIM
jgi:hypothetical protein